MAGRGAGMPQGCVPKGTSPACHCAACACLSCCCRAGSLWAPGSGSRPASSPHSRFHPASATGWPESLRSAARDPLGPPGGDHLLKEPGVRGRAAAMTQRSSVSWGLSCPHPLSQSESGTTIP